MQVKATVHKLQGMMDELEMVELGLQTATPIDGDGRRRSMSTMANAEAHKEQILRAQKVVANTGTDDDTLFALLDGDDLEEALENEEAEAEEATSRLAASADRISTARVPKRPAQGDEPGGSGAAAKDNLEHDLLIENASLKAEVERLQVQVLELNERGS